MALNINGRMKVKTLRADFKKEFGLMLRVYEGRSFADDDATLASIRKGDSKGGEFAPQRNTKVGNLEDKIMDMFGIKTQVAGSDDSYLCDNDKTLAGALQEDEKVLARKVKKAAKKESVSTSDTDAVLNIDGKGMKDKEVETSITSGINPVGILCIDYDDDEVTYATGEAPKLFVFGFFVDEADYDENPEEEPYYILKAYILTGDNGSGFYAGWTIYGDFFADEIDEMEDGKFPDDFLEEKYPEEMKQLRALVAKYTAMPESAGGGFPEGCVLSEDELEDPAEQSYLINNIDEADRLVTQYLEKGALIDLEEMPEEIFNVYFEFTEEEDIEWDD